MVRLLGVPLVRRLLKGIVREANEELEDECRQAKEQLKATQDELSSTRKALATFEKDARWLEAERQKQQSRAEELAVEIRRLQDAHTSELRELKARHEQSERQLQDAHTSELRELKARHEQSERQLQDAHTSELRELKARHEQEMQSQRSELARCQQDCAAARRQQKQAEAALSQVREAHEACRQALTAAEQELASFREIGERFLRLPEQVREGLSPLFPQTGTLELLCAGVQQRTVERLGEWCRSEFKSGRCLEQAPELSELFTRLFGLAYPTVVGRATRTLLLPAIGEEFDSQFHDKAGMRQVRGRIGRVLFPGVRGADGSVVSKAIVEID